MKKLLAIGLLVLGLTTTTLGQVYNFTAYSFNYKTYNANRDYWSDWQGWEKCNIDITMNATTSKIKIYSKTYQEYNIILDEGAKFIDGNSISSFYCVDARGIACRIKLVIRSNNQTEVYVEYSDMSWVYAIYSIDTE